MKENKLFTFNELSNQTGVPQQTLRNWEKDNLIKVAKIKGNRKLFDKNGVNTIEQIVRLKKDGYKMGGIKEIMSENKKVEKKKPANRTKKTPEKINYNSKSITELTDIAKMQGVKYFRQMNKEELVEALQHPRNASKMSEQAKIRTKERYGGKVYGKQNKTITSTTINARTIGKIISLNKQGLSNNEIFNQLSK